MKYMCIHLDLVSSVFVNATALYSCWSHRGNVLSRKITDADMLNS